MNLIKIKDQIVVNDVFFNDELKGKYAYFIRMRYIVPFSRITMEEYMDFERGVKSIEVFAFKRDIETGYIKDSVDWSETERINLIDSYKIKNQYTTTKELTIDQVKQFRWWLAHELLYNLGLTYETKTQKMLNYYDMYMRDDVVESLEMYSQPIQVSKVQVGCGCCHEGSDLSSLYNVNLNPCDCIGIYKKGIHAQMVTDFSDMSFWITKDKNFLKLFKLYIDNILQLNLPMKSTQVSDFVDCGCHQGAADNRYNIILKNLQAALSYMIEDDVNGHKLFITDSLRAWADILYEDMIWM